MSRTNFSNKIKNYIQELIRNKQVQNEFAHKQFDRAELNQVIRKQFFYIFELTNPNLEEYKRNLSRIQTK